MLNKNTGKHNIIKRNIFKTRVAPVRLTRQNIKAHQNKFKIAVE